MEPNPRPRWRINANARQRERRQTDPQWAELRRESARRAQQKRRERSATDPAFKEAERAKRRAQAARRMEKLRADPDALAAYRAKERAQLDPERRRQNIRRQEERRKKRMATDPEYRARRLEIQERSSARRLQRLRTDPEYRERNNALHRARYAEDHTRQRAKKRAYEAARREELNARARDRYRQQRDRIRQYWNDWVARNPERVDSYRRASDHRRRSAPGSFTGEEWRQIKHRYGHRCYYCGAWGMRLWIDHRLPLIRGGWNIATNVVPACRTCNLRKGALTDVEFRDRLAKEPWRRPDPQQHVAIWAAGFGALEIPPASYGFSN